MTENPTALLQRPSRTTAGERAQEKAHVDEPDAAPAPRRWNDPDEKVMLWGLLFFFGLGMYAAAMVVFGMWLTP